MAQNLLINILAKDKTKQALGSVQAGLGRLQRTVFSIQGALAGIGGALVIKSLVNVGSQVENLGVRFAFLFKGMEEGNKAFNNLIDFAARVPFSLEEISAASGNLAVVSKDAEELSKILEVTGNVATVTGLDFAMTATQIQRSFAGGIAAADVFREKGVRALLGFEAGAKATAKETKERFFEVFGPDGEFGKAMEVMAVTFTGTLSMLQDKLFKFKLETNRAGFFDFIKNGLAEINEIIENNSEVLTELSGRLSDFLIATTKNVLLSGAIIVDAMRPVFEFVGKAIKGLLEVLRSLPPGAREFGILGFLMLGAKGKGLVLLIGGFIDEIRTKLGTLLEDFANFNQKILDTRKSLFLVSKEGYDKILKQNKELLEIAEQLKKPLTEVNKETQKGGEYTEEWMKSSQALNEFFKKVEARMILSNEQMKKLLELAGKVKEETKETGFNMGKVADILKEKVNKELENTNDTFSKIFMGGIKNMSRGLAEVLVLGKNFNMTMKDIAQSIMVQIVATLIEEIALRQIRKLLGQDEINNEKKITGELKKQFGLRTAMSFINPLGGFISGLFKANGGSVSKGQPYVVGERGPELFVPNQTGQITQSARGTGGGATTVNFNINTVDASGFEELLVRSRGTITQLINSAVNERGRESLI